MRTWIQSACFGSLVVFAGACARDKSLTVEKLAELTAGPPATTARSFKVTVEGLDLGRARGKDTARTISALASPNGTIEYLRDLRTPISYDPAQKPASAAFPGGWDPLATPAVPSAFDTFRQGWVIRLKAVPRGKLISLQGSAQFDEVTLDDRGFGPVSGPIYSKKGSVVTPNTMRLPKVVSTTTYFSLFAIPGQRYEVTFYRGDVPERHLISVAPGT